MTESILSAGLTCLLTFEVDTESNLVAREALDGAPVFNLFFIRPVTAEPPTDREVPVFRDLFSCKNRLL